MRRGGPSPAHRPARKAQLESQLASPASWADKLPAAGYLPDRAGVVRPSYCGASSVITTLHSRRDPATHSRKECVVVERHMGSARLGEAHEIVERYFGRRGPV